jgi:hypothetical protein
MKTRTAQTSHAKKMLRLGTTATPRTGLTGTATGSPASPCRAVACSLRTDILHRPLKGKGRPKARDTRGGQNEALVPPAFNREEAVVDGTGACFAGLCARETRRSHHVTPRLEADDNPIRRPQTKRQIVLAVARVGEERR